MLASVLALLSTLPLLGAPAVSGWGPGRAAFFHAPAEDTRLRAVEEALFASVHDLFAAAGETPPAPEARLHQAARHFAEALGAHVDGPAASVVLRAALEHAGVTDATTYPFTLRVVGDDPPLEQLAALVEAHVRGRAVTHVGVGVSPSGPRGEGRLATVVFVRRLIELDPFPRHAQPGESVELSGRVPPTSGFPRVVVGVPHGDVVDVPVYLGTGNAFRAAVPFQYGAGRYEVEVLSADDHGVQVANLFPTHVGVAAPQLPVLRLTPPDPPTATLPQLEDRMVTLLNRARRAAGLRPVQTHPVLRAAARDHSADMARHAYFGHEGSDGRTAAERVARRGLRPSRVAETISIAPSTAKAQADLLSSPSHRRQLLDPDMTHVGVGVVPVGTGASRRLVITEDLARLP